MRKSKQSVRWEHLEVDPPPENKIPTNPVQIILVAAFGLLALMALAGLLSVALS